MDMVEAVSSREELVWIQNGFKPIRKIHLAKFRRTLRPEYDFSKGVRGKHATKYAAGTNVVVLQPDVARDFRTAKEVNETLRAVSKMLQQHRKRSGRKTV